MWVEMVGGKMACLDGVDAGLHVRHYLRDGFEVRDGGRANPAHSDLRVAGTGVGVVEHAGGLLVLGVRTVALARLRPSSHKVVAHKHVFVDVERELVHVGEAAQELVGHTRDVVVFKPSMQEGFKLFREEARGQERDAVVAHDELFELR